MGVTVIGPVDILCRSEYNACRIKVVFRNSNCRSSTGVEVLTVCSIVVVIGNTDYRKCLVDRERLRIGLRIDKFSCLIASQVGIGDFKGVVAIVVVGNRRSVCKTGSTPSIKCGNCAISVGDHSLNICATEINLVDCDGCGTIRVVESGGIEFVITDIDCRPHSVNSDGIRVDG